MSSLDIGKVGQTIAYLRKRAGYTQKNLADRIGISDKAVSKWERGLSLPDIAYLGKLAVLLDTDAESLLAGDAIHHDKGWDGLLILREDPGNPGYDTMIYDKPLVYYLLSYFLLSGIKKIVIVCKDKDREYIAKELEGGGRLGITLICCGVQSSEMDIRHGAQLPENIASVLDCDNVMVVHGRNFLYGAGLTRIFQRAMANRERITVLALPKTSYENTVGLCFNDNKRIINAANREKLNTQYGYSEIPIFFCPKKMFGLPFANLPVYVDTTDRGYIDYPVNTWDDVVEVSNIVRGLQRSSGMIIACIEEIAWRRGLISLEELKFLGEQKCDTGYGKYILSLCK